MCVGVAWGKRELQGGTGGEGGAAALRGTMGAGEGRALGHDAFEQLLEGAVFACMPLAFSLGRGAGVGAGFFCAGEFGEFFRGGGLLFPLVEVGGPCGDGAARLPLGGLGEMRGEMRGEGTGGALAGVGGHGWVGMWVWGLCSYGVLGKWVC